MSTQEENKNKKSKVYLFAIILVLILINLMLIYNLFTNNKKLTLTEDKLVDTEQELVELDELRLDLEEELGYYKGANDSLDQVITLGEAEMQKKMAEIQKLLKKENLTKAELVKAKREILNLREKMVGLTNRVDSLYEVNQQLVADNYIMQQQVEAGQAKITEMQGIQTDLTQQVAVGKRLFLQSLAVTPLRKRLIGSGYRPTDKLKRVSKIDVSFALATNDLADKGEKTLYFKLITPNKSTLVDEKLGAGTFNYQGGESAYTLKKVINFQNKNESAIITIPYNDGLTEGEYLLKVFSDTHEMASRKFVLQ